MQREAEAVAMRDGLLAKVEELEDELRAYSRFHTETGTLLNAITGLDHRDMPNATAVDQLQRTLNGFSGDVPVPLPRSMYPRKASSSPAYAPTTAGSREQLGKWPRAATPSSPQPRTPRAASRPPPRRKARTRRPPPARPMTRDDLSVLVVRAAPKTVPCSVRATAAAPNAVETYACDPSDLPGPVGGNRSTPGGCPRHPSQHGPASTGSVRDFRDG